VSLAAPARGVLRALGVDRAVAFTVLSRGTGVLAGPVTLLLLVRSLTPGEQGYYYTFGSIVGLQIFFELGLGAVLVQVVSHERAGLHWAADGRLAGDPHAKGRLRAALHQATLWYLSAAALGGTVIWLTGLWFFGDATGLAVAWRAAWLWLVAATAVNLACSPLFAALEGCGLVAEVAQLNFTRTVATYLTVWGTFLAGGKLLASAAAGTVSLAVGLAWVYAHRRLRGCAADLLGPGGSAAPLSWWREVWPFQWRIALSWLSGYFIFQLFNPVLFHYYGPTAAGRMGASLNLMTTIGLAAAAWLTTKAVPFGTLIAQRRYRELDALFRRSAAQCMAVTALGAAGLVLGVIVLGWLGHPWAARFLPPGDMALLAAAGLTNQAVAALALYLRAHKREPFLVPSVVGAVLMSLSTWGLGRAFGPTGMLAGYLAVSLTVGLGWGGVIFRRCRRLWHGDGIAAG
jgi:hypothetical protein